MGPAPVQSQESVVDEFASLEARLLELGPLFTRHNELRARILSWFPALAADAAATVKGTQASVVISARDNERKVTYAGKVKLSKLWGMKLFGERCSIALKQLPDPRDLAGIYSESKRTGPRHLRAVPLLEGK